MLPIAYVWRSLVRRRAGHLAACLGVALAALVLSAAAMLVDGVAEALRATGQPDGVVVLARGVTNEVQSSLAEDAVAFVAGEAKAGPGGAAAAEYAMVVAMPRPDGALSNVFVRGTGDGSAALRPALRVLEGRAPRPGTDEVMIGRRLRGRLRGFEPGGAIEVRQGRPLAVVGVFGDGGSAYESEVWADRDVLRAALGREGTFSSLRLRLPAALDYDRFRRAVEQDKRHGLRVWREADYYDEQTRSVVPLLRALSLFVSTLIGAGAALGAMVTMHASVEARGREFGLLRALGFPRRAVLSSVLLESVLLAAGSGAAGGLLALALGPMRFSVVAETWSELVFALHPSASAFLRATLVSALMGLLGGLAPALRAARVSPLEALRLD